MFINKNNSKKLDSGTYKGTASDLDAEIKKNKEESDGYTDSKFSALEKEKIPKTDIVDNLNSGGVDKVLSAEQGKVLKQLIDSVGVGGLRSLIETEHFSLIDDVGELPANGTTIMLGKTCYNPSLFLDGVLIPSNEYSIELSSGFITLKEPYADYPVVWVIKDQYPSDIKFSFPTLNLLVNSDLVDSIVVGDVIKILGETEAYDGDHRLVKCEQAPGINGVSIGNGKWLNEVPNSRSSSKISKGSFSELKSLEIINHGNPAYVDISTDNNIDYHLRMISYADGANCIDNANKDLWINKNGVTKIKVSENLTFETVVDLLKRTYLKVDNTAYALTLVSQKENQGAVLDFINFEGNRSGFIGIENASSVSGNKDIAIRSYGDLKLNVTGNLLRNNNQVWDNGTVTSSKNASGYMRFPNGMIIQWGFVTIPHSNMSVTSFNFPISFTSDYTVVANSSEHVGDTGMPIVQALGGSLSVFNIQCGGGMWNATTTKVSRSFYARWIAIGF